MILTWRLLPVAFGLAMLGSACGGNELPNTPENRAYARKVDAICARYKPVMKQLDHRVFNELNYGESEDAVSLLPRLRAVRREETDKLEAVTGPVQQGDNRQVIAEYFDLRLRQLIVLAQLQEAADLQYSEEVDRAMDELSAIAEKRRSIAKDLGLKVCSGVL